MTGGGDGGIWGHWTSRDSLPAFVYTADQDAVPAAAVPPNAPYGKPEMKDPAARGDREHSFQIGNDRLVLVGSNYGTWRLRALSRARQLSSRHAKLAYGVLYDTLSQGLPWSQYSRAAWMQIGQRINSVGQAQTKAR